MIDTAPILEATDIVRVIDERVPLRRAGKDYMARCPFHDEKTPSFKVSQAKRFYHCFGCGAHGDAIGFLCDYERLTFRQAVELLAREAGIDLDADPDAGRRRMQARRSRQAAEREAELSHECGVLFIAEESVSPLSDADRERAAQAGERIINGLQWIYDLNGSRAVDGFSSTGYVDELRILWRELSNRTMEREYGFALSQAVPHRAKYAMDAHPREIMAGRIVFDWLHDRSDE